MSGSLSDYDTVSHKYFNTHISGSVTTATAQMSPACAHDTPILPNVAQKFASSITDKARKLALFNSSTHTHTHTATHSHTHIGQKLYAGVYCLLPSASLNYFAIYFNKFNVLRHYFLAPCQPVSGFSPLCGCEGVCVCVCIVRMCCCLRRRCRKSITHITHLSAVNFSASICF